MKQLSRKIILFVLLIIIIAACQGTVTQSEPTNIPLPTSTPSPESTDTPTPSNTPTPTLSPTTTTTATSTGTPTRTDTPTPTATPTMAPTPIGSQLRAYTDKYVYLDAGHEEPEKLAFPSERLAISGYAYFPTWSPDGNWLLTLQGEKVTHGYNLERISLHTAKLYVSNLVTGESKELAEIVYPDVSHAIEGGGVWSITGDYILRGNFVAWSPDSSQIAYLNYLDHSSEADNAITFEILVISLTGGEPVKIGEASFVWTDPSYDMRPFAWSPDGSHLAYTSYGSNNSGLHVAKADASESRRIFASRYVSLPTWTQDGNSIVFQRAGHLQWNKSLVNGSWHLDFYPVAGELLQIDVDGSNLRSLNDYVLTPVLSPDGKMVAYVEGNRILVMKLEDRSEKLIANVCGLDDYRIAWSPDSKKIAFESEEVLYENGQSNGCRYADTKYVDIYSTEGEQIAAIDYTEIQWFQDWHANRPRYAFSPDSDWFAITYRQADSRDIQIQLVDLRTASHFLTNIQGPYAGSIAWSRRS